MGGVSYVVGWLMLAAALSGSGVREWLWVGAVVAGRWRGERDKSLCTM